MVKPLLEVNGLSKMFSGGAGQMAIRKQESMWAVKDVSLTVGVGETLGIVGESGSGKTTLARCILQLIRPTTGTVLLNDINLTNLRGASLRLIRANLGMIFQDPYSSLNSRWSIERVISDPLIVNGIGTKKDRAIRVSKLLEEVNLPDFYRTHFPGQLSGGERQRVAIARSLSLEPKLVFCDEPTSSLDVSVQAQILNLLQAIQKRLGVSFIFISHNMAVVRQVSNRVVVMRYGQVVEDGDVDQVFNYPKNEYTRTLIESVLSPQKGGGLMDHSTYTGNN
jgi:ABC-type glutathione transport system ATPase component